MRPCEIENYFLPNGSLLRKIKPGFSHHLRGNGSRIAEFRSSSVDLANLEFEQIASKNTNTKYKKKFGHF